MKINISIEHALIPTSIIQICCLLNTMKIMSTSYIYTLGNKQRIYKLGSAI